MVPHKVGECAPLLTGAENPGSATALAIIDYLSWRCHKLMRGDVNIEKRLINNLHNSCQTIILNIERQITTQHVDISYCHSERKFRCGWQFMVYRMELDKTTWSWKSDQIVQKTLPVGVIDEGWGSCLVVLGSVGVGSLVGVRCVGV